MFFSAADGGAGDDYLVDHSIVIYLMGPDGGIADFFHREVPGSQIAHRVKARVLAARAKAREE